MVSLGPLHSLCLSAVFVLQDSSLKQGFPWCWQDGSSYLPSPKPVLLKLQGESESSGGLVRTKLAGHQPRSF